MHSGADLSHFFPAQGRDLWPGWQRGGQNSWPSAMAPSLPVPVQNVGPECPTSPGTVPGWQLPRQAALSPCLCCSAGRRRALTTPPRESAAAPDTPTFQDCFLRKKEAEEKKPCGHPLSHPSMWHKLLPLVFLGSLTASFPARLPGRVSALPLSLCSVYSETQVMRDLFA